MLLAAAAIWLVVFIPGWVRRNEERQMRRANDMSSRSEIQNLRKSSNGTKRNANAARSARLGATRNIFGTLGAVFASTAVLIAVFAIASPALWVAFSIATTLAILTATVSLQAAQKLANLLENSAKSRGETAAKMSYKMRVEAIAASLESSVEIDPRAWQRQPLPDQLVPIGQLHLPESAEVIEISSASKADAPSELTSDELNEIMRRRRAVG